MTEYLDIRASEALGQEELVSFLRSRYPEFTRQIGNKNIEGARCVETRVPSTSAAHREIAEFIALKRKQKIRGFIDFKIGRYLRKYTTADLSRAEILRLKIDAHFEPCGEECGTIYQTLCEHCNWGRQLSPLILDLHRVPQHKDLAESIAWIEWVVSPKFIHIFREHGFKGADFHRVVDIKKPTKQSSEWYQLHVTGQIGKLAACTKFGKDPFSPGETSWRCPLGHSVVAAFLSEVYLNRSQWDGSDIALTKTLFGQGTNLLRPTPLIFISQRLYRILKEANLKGFSYEVAHLT